MRPKAVLGFDVDGTLTKRNTELILPEKLPLLFNFLDDLGYFVIPVTGKPLPYALRILSKNGLEQQGAIAENAGVFIKPNENLPTIFGPNLESIKELKIKLGLNPDAKDKQVIILKDKESEVIIDPEDISILTIFTNSQHVSHKWEFNPKLSTKEVWDGIEELIIENNLNNKLQLLPAFPDGAIQVIRKDGDEKTAIDKSKYPEVVKIMYKLSENIPMAMFGDGHNDIAAMNSDLVTPITFANSDSMVKDFAPSHGGYVSEFDALEGLGIVDGINWLLKNNFFHDLDNSTISKQILKIFPEYK